MTDRPRLPAGTLHAPAHREPHVDSEEAVQYECRRVSRELDSVQSCIFSQPSLKSPNTPITSHGLPDDQASCADAQPDAVNPSQTVAPPKRSPAWCDHIPTFWSTHISLTIEEGAHRDHLGVTSLPSNTHRNHV
jgi:hypothetical protein